MGMYLVVITLKAYSPYSHSKPLPEAEWKEQLNKCLDEMNARSNATPPMTKYAQLNIEHMTMPPDPEADLENETSTVRPKKGTFSVKSFFEHIQSKFRTYKRNLKVAFEIPYELSLFCDMSELLPILKGTMASMGATLRMSSSVEYDFLCDEKTGVIYRRGSNVPLPLDSEYVEIQKKKHAILRRQEDLARFKIVFKNIKSRTERPSA